MTQAPAEGTDIKWLLQPIGQAAQRGPQNFEHSVRRGVELADYAAELGDQADDLKTLFPGGRARFWGSVRAKKESHGKNKAIDTTRPGDEVLFYAEGSFIARATIVAAFRNRALAEKIWRKDKDGNPWEYMVALDNVVEISVPARRILAKLDYKAGHVQSLIQVTAANVLRLRPLLDDADPLTLPLPKDSVIPRQKQRAPRLGSEDLLRMLGNLNTYSQPDGSPARHKPLALLWAIGRLTAGQERLAPWEEFEAEVGSLLDEFGGEHDRRTPEYPFWHLRSSGLWEVQGIDDSGFKPTVAALRAAKARAGFSSDAAKRLKRALTRAQAVRRLHSTYFAESGIDKDVLLDRVGLDGYSSASGRSTDAPAAPGPVARRPATGTRPDRDRSLPDQVKILHEDRCQVCGEQLETRDSHYSEAAHIQGVASPHLGPDVLENLLCLCPNHHKQFDHFGIYIDVDWAVRHTRSGEQVGTLTRIPEHRVDPEYVEYHRDQCLNSE
ncbi:MULTISPECIES: HNH endonuclease [Streptomyces]|uniref:HNH endonuclease n=1 Tax=Streptomyces TaxID=1883 RepID=UPI001F29087B|nr:HNH endonuclease [Streptomyces sp. Sge12]